MEPRGKGWERNSKPGERRCVRGMNRGDPPCNHGGGTAVFMQFMSTAVDSLHGKRERSLITSVLAVCGLSDIHSEHSQNCVT